MPNPIPQPKEQNPLQELVRNLKIGYITGLNPIARAHTGWGFLPAKNASLNLGKLLMNIPYDPEMRVKPNDPLQQLRKVTAGIGRVERITNTYGKPRVKLAD
jgi:hypothetical protein